MSTISKRCLVIGNSPAANLVTGRELVSFGVNRIRRTHDVDFVVIADQDVADTEDFKDSVLFVYEDVVLRQPSPALSYRLQRRCLYQFPSDPGDPLVRAGFTPGYAIQLAILAGYDVGLIGVDFNSLELPAGGTHCYGNGKELGSTGSGAMTMENQLFFANCRNWAESRGRQCVNLSPEESPFTRTGVWEKKSLQEWLRR